MADTHDVRFTVGMLGGQACVCVASVDGVSVPPAPAWMAPTPAMAARVCEALNNWGLATAIVTAVTRAIMTARVIDARLDDFMEEG